MSLSPAASWALLAGLFVAVLVAVFLINRLDRVWTDARDRRRHRVHGFDEEYRYQRARAAVARQVRTSNVRLGHNTREGNPNE